MAGAAACAEEDEERRTGRKHKRNIYVVRRKRVAE